MHATSSYQNGGSKITKIAIVTLLHAGLVFALLQMRTTPPDGGQKAPQDVLLVETAPTIEPEPTQVIDPPPTTVPPIFVPPTIIPTVHNPATAVTTTTTMPTTPPPVIAGPTIIAPPTTPPPPAVATIKEYTPVAAGNCAVPNYPAASARNGDTGTVGLALLIAADGHVAQSKVTTSSGHRELDRAAVAALSNCKFKPANTNGVPESAWGKIAYVWTLD